MTLFIQSGESESLIDKHTDDHLCEYTCRIITLGVFSLHVCNRFVPFKCLNEDQTYSSSSVILQASF